MKTLRLPTIAELKAWVETRPAQNSICADAEHCLVADWILEHNDDLLWLRVVPDEHKGYVGWQWIGDPTGYTTDLPHELDDLAGRFDLLDQRDEDLAVDYTPTKEEVMKLF